MFNALRDMVKRSWGDEGQQSDSRAGISTGQTSNTARNSGSNIPTVQYSQQPGLTQTANKPHGRQQPHKHNHNHQPPGSDRYHPAHSIASDAGLEQPRSTTPGSGRREAQGAHRPSMGGPRTLAGGTSTTRKRGRAHLRGLVRHQPGPYTRSFHHCTRRSNTHTQPSRNTTAAHTRRRRTQIPTIRTTKQRLPWSRFCDSGRSKKTDQQPPTPGPAAARATQRPKPTR